MSTKSKSKKDLLSNESVSQSLEEELADDIEDLEELHQDDLSKEVEREAPTQRQTFSSTQIKSYIAILTSALGGIDHGSDIQPPPYKLGDEALLCLQDIKKWLKTYDDERSSWVVAVACAESGLVKDLVVILALWEESRDKKTSISGYSKEYDVKIARLCLELLIILTWPIELADGMYQEQLDNFVYLKKQQLSYRKHILTYKKGIALKAIIGIALPIIALPENDRTASQNGILRLSITIFRNILAIEPTGISKIAQKANHQGELAINLPKDVSLEDISIGACINAFEENMVFTFLLTVCSSLSQQRGQGVICLVLLEAIYYLTRRLRPHYIMSQDTNKIDQSEKSGTSLDLNGLLSIEKEMKSKFKKNSSTRHGRFGTSISLQTPSMGRLPVFGGGSMLTSKNSIAAFDSHKVWHKPERFKYLPGEEVIFSEVTLGATEKKYFYAFVSDFIEGVLNPFFHVCTKQFTSDDTNKSSGDKVRYLFFISWFLEAQRLKHGNDVSTINYALVANVLSEEAFRLIFRFMRESNQTGNRQWGVAHASLIAIKEILYITNTMSLSDNVVFRDAAADIKEKLFHTQSYLGDIAEFPKVASKRSPEFVDTCVELVDIILKTLEEYSKEDMNLVLDDKLSRKTKKNLTKEQVIIDQLHGESDDRLKEQANELSQQRKKRFSAIQGEFINIPTVETHMLYLKRYRDLPEKSIKRAIKYFHKVFFERKEYTYLYRLDFLLTLHSMLSEEGLSKRLRVRNHISQFLTHFMKQLRKSLDTTPSLYVEMLFGNISAKELKYYLNTGDIMAAAVTNTKVVDRIVEIRNGENMELDMKVTIMVLAAVEASTEDIVEWLSEELDRILKLRLLQLGEHNEETETPSVQPVVAPIVVHSDVGRFKRSLVTEPRIRFILKLAGFTLPTTTADKCVFGVDASIATLSEVLSAIKQTLLSPPYLGDGKQASDFIMERRIGDDYAKYNEDLDGDYDVFGGGYNSDEEHEFDFDTGFSSIKPSNSQSETGNDLDELDRLEAALDESSQRLPKGVARKKGSKSDKGTSSRDPNKKRKPRHNNSRDLAMHDISDTEENHQAHSRGPISSKYIDDDESDEETDEAFFAREKLLRQLLNVNNGTLTEAQIQQFMNGTISEANLPDVSETSQAGTSIRPEILDFDSDSDDEDLGNTRKRSIDDPVSPSAKRPSVAPEISDDEAENLPIARDESDEELENEKDSDQESDKDSDNDSDDASDSELKIASQRSTTATSFHSESPKQQTSGDVVKSQGDEAAGKEDDDEDADTTVVRRRARVIFDDDDDDNDE